MAKMKWQEATLAYNTAHAKAIATGHAMRCPFCKGGTGETVIRTKIRQKKKEKPRVIRALCFTCWAIYGRRLKKDKAKGITQILDNNGKVVATLK